MKRRTLQEKEEVLKLKEIVINKIINYSITPNKISSNVKNISHPTIINIINRKTHYPSLEKLKNVNNYIIENYENVAGVNNTRELTQSEKYDRILEKLEAQSLQLEIIFEVLTSSCRAKEIIKVLNKENFI